MSAYGSFKSATAYNYSAKHHQLRQWDTMEGKRAVKYREGMGWDRLSGALTQRKCQTSSVTPLPPPPPPLSLPSPPAS